MKTEEEKQIVRIVNNVLYFEDSSDYATALHEVLAILKPELYGDFGLIQDLKFIDKE